ncbi:hypothetical protein ABZX75_32640 [Streptomyces sp. NPDC003038]|uniref:hypothetical protein n=1 Tax=unclassified Streptomyces TaxID=2593676 RepID=UPI0033AA8E4E
MPGPPARSRGSEKGDLQKEPPGGLAIEPADHGLGRSRGGLTTKIQLAVEQGQKPLSIVITAGQRGDSPQFEPVLDTNRSQLRVLIPELRALVDTSVAEEAEAVHEILALTAQVERKAHRYLVFNGD